MELREVVELLADRLIERLRKEASGLLGMDWPLARSIARETIWEALTQFADDAPDDDETPQFGRYLS